jgi:hypothetical protein
MHESKAPQPKKHCPQFRRSSSRLRQVSPQSVHPGSHWQTPATQVWPEAHATPHVPQFAGSEERSLQTPEHDVMPAGQPHCPPMHSSAPAHIAPQAPQCSRLVMMLWQEPLQQMLSTPQTLLHSQVASLNVVLKGQRVDTQTSPQSW